MTQAETEEQLILNLKEAVALWFEVQDEKEMKAAAAGPSSPGVRELALKI